MRHKITKKRKSATPAKRSGAPRRRRRISGTAAGIQGKIMTGIGVGAGLIGGQVLNNVAQKQFPSLHPLMISAVQAGVGLALPMIIKQNKFVADMGNGVFASALGGAAKNLGIINGMGMGSIGRSSVRYRINGTPGFRAIAGPQFDTMSGAPDISTIAGPRTRGKMRFD